MPSDVGSSKNGAFKYLKDYLRSRVQGWIEKTTSSAIGFRSNFKKFLVDRQRKRLVDVVVRLHDPTDQAPKLRHLRVLAHVQLDDDPRTPIQQSVGEEFRQHDGMVTILMFYCCRASPKHHYNIIEDYGGGAHRTRLRERS